jgi:hypothetical protein
VTLARDCAQGGKKRADGALEKGLWFVRKLGSSRLTLRCQKQVFLAPVSGCKDCVRHHHFPVK